MLRAKVNSLLQKAQNNLTKRGSANNWQQQLQQAFKTPQQLLDYLQLPNPLASELANQAFNCLVPLSYAQRMEKGNSNDPLLKQVLPVADELLTAPGFSSNPVGDLQAQAAPGLLHKYHARVLLITTGACPIHCRYCFRREFPYQSAQLASSELEQTLDYIAQHADINEVILSGGDPLILSNQRLATLITSLEKIPRLKRLRIHSRVPVVLPARIDSDLLKLFSTTRLQVVLVIHANHANELNSSDVTQALRQCKQHDIQLLNQAVLLRDINDTVERLCDLSEALFATGVQPYYLHVLDKVTGASHFDVDEVRIHQLYTQLQSRLSGYLVPRLVREIAGKESKTLLYPNSKIDD